MCLLHAQLAIWIDSERRFEHAVSQLGVFGALLFSSEPHHAGRRQLPLRSLCLGNMLFEDRLWNLGDLLEPTRLDAREAQIGQTWRVARRYHGVTAYGSSALILGHVGQDFSESTFGSQLDFRGVVLRLEAKVTLAGVDTRSFGLIVDQLHLVDRARLCQQLRGLIESCQRAIGLLAHRPTHQLAASHVAAAIPSMSTTCSQGEVMLPSEPLAG